MLSNVAWAGLSQLIPLPQNPVSNLLLQTQGPHHFSFVGHFFGVLTEREWGLGEGSYVLLEPMVMLGQVRQLQDIAPLPLDPSPPPNSTWVHAAGKAGTWR